MEPRPRRRPLRSIKARVTLGAVLVVALALAGGAAGGLAILSGSLTSGVEASLRLDLETLDDRIEDGSFSVGDSEGDALVALRGDAVDDDRDGDDALDDDHDGEADPDYSDDDAAELPTVAEDRFERIRIDGEPYLVASERTDAGVLTVGRPLEQVDEAVATAATLLAVAVPLAVLLIGGVVWIVAGRALAPVERMRRQVDDIDASELDRRLDGGGAGDEIDRLAGTMNGMLDRLERSQRTQRQFVSDASHELRSPLATVRQHAELAAAHPETTSAEELTQVVLHEGARMQELVEALLLLARLDEHRGIGPAAVVDVDDLAFAEIRRLRGLGVVVDGRGISPGRVRGSSALLGRALRNLADNAARHARQRVAIRVRAEGDRVVVTVEDDGAGVAPDQRERVFERFFRLDEGRARDAGGSGLGLAIVREVALAHGGAVSVGSGESGGAVFTLVLPAASDS
ncbi:HAMP domain-containing histidine kinase [Leucobacter sp. CSA1]|uniref:histidine kinase n=1 Tax=Leucobacter chromiisoli TaxID=2796471 RepID=A0A934UUW9_9MICO|nr:HAMP domain-containing sensor histidine kinase [Leucobacter chromiisoli]MBK0418352.1 HAMP domain-containing histidine kinase [Leucobacter chromiisoli]